MDLRDTSAIVTGAASGLGAATARRLAAAGVHVVIADVDAGKGPGVAREVDGQFARVDVLDTESIEAAASAAMSVAPLRSLVCCAGISSAKRTIGRDGTVAAAHSLEAFAKIIAVNLTGTFNCIRVAASAMSLTEALHGGARGAIVTTSSIAAFDGQIGQAAYSASKAGIIGLNLPVARDLAPAGIRINCIVPGLVDTPIYGEGDAARKWKDELAQDVLFPKRLGSPEEFAALAEHLLTNDYLNAEAIRLDAGARLGPRSR